MKILTWNCNGAFWKKFEELSLLDADILVIQECENPKECSHLAYKKWVNNFLWIGENKNTELA
jgi:exonuclease III